MRNASQKAFSLARLQLLQCMAIVLLCLWMLPAQGVERIARFDQGMLRYSNWNAPYVTVDTCLDITATRLVVPDTVYFSGRPYPVVEVGPNAFRGCAELTAIKGLGLSPSSRVYAFSATPPECDENAFARYSAALHVPKRSLAAYVDAPYWCNFTNITGDAVEPEALEWEQESVSLKLGDRLALEGPFLTPANTGLDVSIVSSDPDVVALSRSYDYNLGEYTYTIQGVKAGEADLIATCAWLEARMHVTVTEDVITITLDRHEVELEAGTMVTLTPSSSPVEVEYVATSSDRSVATARVVNGRVQVVGAKPGTAVVTVSDAEGVAVPDTCRVTVVRPIGDATGDGYIDIDDVNAMINVILELVPRPVDDQQPYYDLDSSGRVDIDDINLLINLLLAQ